MKTFERLTELQDWVGREIGLSDWILVDQGRIDKFALATGDHQWIHIDTDRAAHGPFGITIAHGFLTLSLLPEMFSSAFEVLDSTMGINYGLDRVRFPAPVPAGSHLRGRLKLLRYEPLDGGGVQLAIEVTVERQGGDKPVCVAQSLMRRYTAEAQEQP